MKLKVIAATCLAFFCLNAHADVTPTTQDKARATGEAFLQKNKTKPGVKTLPDGLQYKVIQAGNGTKPSDQDVVTVEYAGKLVDGTEFDSSEKHGGTVDFQVGQVIPGRVEALKMMQPGAVWEIYIPSDLAYGEAGAPPVIGPNETLIFKVKLVNIKKS